MLDEIVQNTELLVDLPPDHYKFPHRTFMEYFAANYFHEEGKIDELLQLYATDKGKWQETLALFCGLNLNEDIAKKCLDTLEGYFDRTGTDILVFRALVESAKIRPDWAAPLLEKARLYLNENFNYELVEYLGYIGANPNLTYASEATDILTQKLKHSTSDEELTALLIALLANRSSKADVLIKRYFENVTIEGFYTFLKHDTKSIVTIMQQFNIVKLKEFIRKVAENSDIPVLLNILKNATAPDIKCYSALSIAHLSEDKNTLFYDSINESNDFHVSRTEADTIALFEDWSWEKHYPMSANGKKMMAIIAHYLVISFSNKPNFRDSKSQIDRLLSYYTFALLNKEKKFHYTNFFTTFQLFNIPFRTLKVFWNISIFNIRFSLFKIVGFAFLFGFAFSFYIITEFYGKILLLSSLFLVLLVSLDNLEWKKLKSIKEKLNSNEYFILFILTFSTHFILLYPLLHKEVKLEYSINKNRIQIVFLVSCLVIFSHLYYINTILADNIKFIYFFFYSIVFFIFYIIEAGFIGFLIPPLSVLGLLGKKDNTVK